MKGVLDVRYFKIGEFARLIGKSPQTLRNWDKTGVLRPAYMSEDGRKFYSKEQLDHFINDNQKLVIGYCRVNNYNQSDILGEQVSRLKEYLDDMQYEYQIISEIGSGLKYNRKGLIDLLELITTNKVGKIVALKKDSLVRFGFEMIEQLCRIAGCDLEYIDDEIDCDDYCSDVASIIRDFDMPLERKKAMKAKRRIQELING